jgi:hypothetical protein
VCLAQRDMAQKQMITRRINTVAVPTAFGNASITRCFAKGSRHRYGIVLVYK